MGSDQWKAVNNFGGAFGFCYVGDVEPERAMASGSVDSSIIVWDPASGNQLTKLAGHSSSVCSLAWSPNGQQLASGSYDRSIILWDPANGKQLTTLVGHTGSVFSVAWRP